MKFLALWLLQGYKRWVSPVFPPACRYVPTCSEYAMEAVERYGVLRGGAMAGWRLLRCHPFVTGGLDPVVKKLTLSQRTRRGWGTRLDPVKTSLESHSFAKNAKEWGTQVRGQECPRHTS